MKHTKDQLPARRGKSRFLAALPAVLHHDGEDLPCSADDLSRSGVLLQGKMPLPESPDIETTISTPTGDRSTRVMGHVMHAHADPESGEVRLGVQFEILSDEQADTIDLIVSRVVEGMAPAALSGVDPKASLGEIRLALGKITPAHRMTLAGRCGLNERAILKHDPDPHVLEALARNPNINLHEIKSLLRRSDLLPSTLEIIADDIRWRSDEELKIAIATHTRVTFTTADKIVRQMSDLAIARLIQRPGLQPGVKQKLMTKLSRKNRG
jgi:hypothetical protein